MLSRRNLCRSAAALGLGLLAGADAADSPLPRIGVKEGRLADPGGTPFHPRGVNYIRLHRGWHSTFSPASYDGGRAGRMFKDLADHGFNTARVFVDPNTGDGIAGTAGSATLSPAYLGNVVDFLQRARRTGIRVIPSLLGIPACSRYRQLQGAEVPQVAGTNRQYLHPGWVQAKARYVADFAQAIADADRSLLSTILAYELDNETELGARQAPFSLGKGKLEWNGRAYLLDSDQELQQLADDSVVAWANACVDAIRRVDPDALVSVNVFTFAAVGRSGPAHLLTDRTRDSRFPARPLALSSSRLSYLDIHFYPLTPKTLDRDVASIELDAVRQACARTGQPLIMGEFGAFRKAYGSVAEAAEAMTQHLRRVHALGFGGSLYWTYDCDEQPELWNARSAAGEIFAALTQASH